MFSTLSAGHQKRVHPRHHGQICQNTEKRRSITEQMRTGANISTMKWRLQRDLVWDLACDSTEEVSLGLLDLSDYTDIFPTLRKN